jgi:tRNA U38,U39,U40 pseudouridine synthase TruA
MNTLLPLQTNKKFSARHMCEGRTYEYYLPASMLGAPGLGKDEQAELSRLCRESSMNGMPVWVYLGYLNVLTRMLHGRCGCCRHPRRRFGGGAARDHGVP